MRTLRPPYSGYMSDRDQVVYWPMQSTSAVITAALAGRDLHYENGSFSARSLQSAGPGTASMSTSPFHPAKRFGAIQLSNEWLENSTDFNSIVGNTGLTKGVSLATSWSLAMWYDVRAGSTATQCLIEFSGARNGTEVSVAQYSPLRVLWLPNQQLRIERTIDDGGALITLVDSPVVPQNGWLGVTVGLNQDGSEHLVRIYHSQAQGARIATRSLGDAAPSGGSAGNMKWMLGGSRSYAPVSVSSPTMLANATLAEVAVWSGVLSDSKMQSLYGDCVRPWDEDRLMRTGNGVARYRVKIVKGSDDDSDSQLDLTQLDGINWVKSGRITEDVDTPVSSCDLVLLRRRGPLADLSPLNTQNARLTDLGYLIDLRQRVIVERAVVPPLWNMQGWEWRPRWDGFIDAWELNDSEISLSCSDKGVALEDAFIMDPRGYAFVSTKPLEEYQQQVITDFRPTIRRSTSSTRIGYRGGDPTLFTEAGSVFCPTFGPCGINLRYGDVASGKVLAALQTISDQIGFDTRFKYHDPSGDYRLTSYAPKRNFVIPVDRVGINDPSTPDYQVVTLVPHGLTLGSTVTLSGSTSHNFGGSVATVIGPYQFGVAVSAGAPDTTNLLTSTGTLTFRENLSLQDKDIKTVSSVGENVDNIRNHVTIRFQRTPSTIKSLATVTLVSGNLVMVDVSEPLPNIDPDNNGFTFEISDIGGTASGFNGSYTGKLYGDRRIISLEPNTVVSPVGTVSGCNFNTTYQRFRQFTSTSTPSVNSYGLLPMAVYEGTTLEINDFNEAVQLANSLIDDCSEPTVNATMTTRPLPLDLHDMVRLNGHPKGHWTSPLSVAIVSIDESFDGGASSCQYGLRHTRPSRGTQWAKRLRLDVLKPAIPVNTPATDFLTSADQPTVRLRESGKLGLEFSRGNKTDAAWRRVDSVEVYTGVSVDFIPDESTRRGSYNGDYFDVSGLTPGQTHYVKWGVRDIHGNLSGIVGASGLASSISVLSAVPRFTDLSAAAVVVSASTTQLLSTTPAVVDLGVDDGSDPTGITYDTFGNYDVTNKQFVAPATGLYNVGLLVQYGGDPGKIGSEASPWTATFNLQVKNSLGTVLFGRPTVVSGTGCTQNFQAALNFPAVFASSGNILTWVASCQSTETVQLRFKPSVASFWGHATYLLANQKAS